MLARNSNSENWLGSIKNKPEQKQKWTQNKKPEQRQKLTQIKNKNKDRNELATQMLMGQLL